MKKRIALIGYGYWGPNLLRNLFEARNCEVAYCCDLDKDKFSEIQRRYPSVAVTNNFEELIQDSSVDGVVLATPTRTHFPLAKTLLKSGKDVLIEKPMTLNSREAAELVAISHKEKRIIMVDHTFLFNDAVMMVKKIIDSKEVGDILYIDSVRVNLGLFQKDSNVIFDLAAHDFSIINFILGNTPVTVQAHADAHFGNQEDVAYIFAQYPNKISAHVHVSWLSPAKIRRMLIVGTKKMIVYDDIEPTEKVRVYDKGVIVPKRAKELEQAKIGYRTGDVWLPKVNILEPLALLVHDFLGAIESRKALKSNGEFGAQVVKILEKSTKSARKKGKIVSNGSLPRSNGSSFSAKQRVVV